MKKVLRLFSMPAPSGLRPRVEAAIEAARAARTPEPGRIRIEENRGEVAVMVSYASHQRTNVAAFADLLKSRFPDELFSDGESIDDLVASSLTGTGQVGVEPRPLSVAVAESLTGGLLSARLTEPPGSGYYQGGVVGYADQAKVKIGIPPPLLATISRAVTPEIAQAMASAARDFWGAEIGIGVTGWAGPSGGTPTHPVGTVCLAATDGLELVEGTLSATGDRASVRDVSTTAAMHLVWRLTQRIRARA